nr:MAG: hypothetical protein [Totiviridae sp.]
MTMTRLFLRASIWEARCSAPSPRTAWRAYTGRTPRCSPRGGCDHGWRTRWPLRCAGELFLIRLKSLTAHPTGRRCSRRPSTTSRTTATSLPPFPLARRRTWGFVTSAHLTCGRSTWSRDAATSSWNAFGSCVPSTTSPW